MNKSIAILGAGKLGVTLAQLAIKAGYTVYIVGSESADKIKLSIRVLAPSAHAVTSEQAIQAADLVILALPLGKYKNLPKDTLAKKLVIDAMNYWWEVDGHDESLANPTSSTSELVQDFLADSRIVKALSHMGYHHLHDEARPAGNTKRKAIAIAGNNPQDVRTVSQLIDDLGFDPLPIGSLAAVKALEPGSPAFGANVSIDALRKLI